MVQMFYPLEVMRLRNDAGLRSVIGATFGDDVRPGNIKPIHQGWDLYAQPGTPAFAIADGIVIWVVEAREGGKYGLQILIQFNRDGTPSSGESMLYAFYAHMQEVSVQKNDFVRAGSQIGKTGIRGNANKQYPHLHFEIRTTSRHMGGMVGRLDPSTVLGGELLACGSEEIGGVDTIRMVCTTTGTATPIPDR